MAASSSQAKKPGDVEVTVVEAADGKLYRSAQEGLARIYVPLSDGSSGGHPEKNQRQVGGGIPNSEQATAPPQQVFFNPIQQFNRDLSVLAIKAYGEAVLERRAAAFAQKKSALAAGKKRKRAERGGVDGEGVADRDMPERPQKKGAEGGVEENTERAEAAENTKRAEAAENTERAEAAENTETAAEAATAAPKADGSSLPPLRILDALSATGLRALRYAHELPFRVAVTANDLLPAAAAAIRRNVELNGLQQRIRVTQSDALAHLYTTVASDLSAAAEASLPWRSQPSLKYDVIDLDPYGSAAGFFDAAVQAVRNDGGLLAVTCTDPGVWASQGYPEKCFALYGGVPMKGAHSHEAGLRIILHGLATAAARYGLALTPQLSLSIDYYCRVFVTVTRSPARVKFLAGRSMLVYNCDQGCGAWAPQPLLRNRAQPHKNGRPGVFYKHTVAAAPPDEASSATGPHCVHCGTKMHLAGPMYAGPLHQAGFVRRILDDLPQAAPSVYGTTERIRGMLQTALEELVEGPGGQTAREELVKGPGGQTERPGKAAEEERGTGTDPSPSETEPAAVLDPVPFFFLPTQLAKAMHCQTPNEDAVRGALLRLGYHVTRSHCRAGSIKTDAPWPVLWHVMREWVRQKSPVKADSIKPGSLAERLLRGGAQEGKQEGKQEDEQEDRRKGSDNGSEQAEGRKGRDNGSEQGESKQSKHSADEFAHLEVVFDEKLGRQHRGSRLMRYQLNPRENWGPMSRAKGH